MSPLQPVVVVDSSAFMCLEKEPEHFGYFTQLFSGVLIPHEVAAELVSKSGETPQVYLERHGLVQLVQIVGRVELEPFVAYHRPPLDRGEAQVISLAVQRGLPAVIEERRGRNFANRNGVPAANMAAFALRGVANRYIFPEDATAMLETMHRVHMFGERLYAQFEADLEQIVRDLTP